MEWRFGVALWFGGVLTVFLFHNRNPLNLDSSDQRIRLFCDLNLNLDYESVDLPLEVDQQIQSHGLPIILCKIMAATCGKNF